MTSTRPTLLLVHGAWHRPAVWDRLRAELDVLGYQTRAVDLPTSGPDARGGMQDDAAAVRKEIAAIGGPVVVVAHSYGGIPVSEAATGLSEVEHLVYLTAYQLDRGESMFSFHGVPDPVETDVLIPITGDPRTAFYGDLSDADAEAAIGQLVDQRLRACVDRVNEPAWRSIPSTYIVCTNDQAIPVPLQEKMAARASSARRIESSHSPFLSRPVELAALLDEIVTARG
ncbi:alpha/beta hydrolase [Micromonospora sp. NBC_00330]|uniref:alpha/beta fold hydrolase n=1 Tax=Micromonospora sp. NBC_00330 TaxID=2903585 RepID=UPI002E2B599E|nr:alpha/beta hydrolase [Micromonospora sp. NBC_00330]